MGLGKMILRSMIGAPVRRHSNSIIHTAVASASAAAAGAVVANLMNSHQQQQAISSARPAAQNTSVVNATHVNTLLGKLALCYYMARIDGIISVDERLELDKIVSEIMTDASIPSSEKGKVDAIVNDQNISFATATAYLDKAEPSALISFVNDIDMVAKATGGITVSEQKVIDMFKDYVERKTGHSFKQDELNQDVVSVNLTCPNCAGQMELDSTMLKACCPFCGSSKIIDANQISKVMAEIETSRRAGLQ